MDVQNPTCQNRGIWPQSHQSPDEAEGHPVTTDEPQRPGAIAPGHSQ